MSDMSWRKRQLLKKTLINVGGIEEGGSDFFSATNDVMELRDLLAAKGTYGMYTIEDRTTLILKNIAEVLQWRIRELHRNGGFFLNRLKVAVNKILSIF